MTDKPLIKFEITVMVQDDDGGQSEDKFIEWFPSSIQAVQETADLYPVGTKIIVKKAES